MQNSTSHGRSNPVAIWLLIGVFMIIVQVLLGGITRLTGSGLSITEWKPILGALPPMNEADWNRAFEQYKQIGQYKHLNFEFTLSDFKFIYFWEWFHREWARFIGVVFIIPFIWFVVKRRIEKWMINPMIILFLLGLLQAMIGWIMVASGLNDEMLYVDHIRLAVHFISALGLLCYTLWFALRLLIPASEQVIHPVMRQRTQWYWSCSFCSCCLVRLWRDSKRCILQRLGLPSMASIFPPVYSLAIGLISLTIQLLYISFTETLLMY
jgi:cytochrome c oxidase assembly protein subunit 15